MTPEELFTLLKLNFEKKENEYFPTQKRLQFKQNFDLFDRNHDGQIYWSEVREIVFSLDYDFSEEALSKQLFDVMISHKEKSEEEVKGINFDEFLVLISKEIKEKDLNATLTEAFKFLDKENKGSIESQTMRDLLQYDGYGYNEEQIETFMRFADPKNEGQVAYYNFIQLISNLEGKKKKGKGKKKSK